MIATINATSFTEGRGYKYSSVPFESTSILGTSHASLSRLSFIHPLLFSSSTLKMGFSMELTPYTTTMGGMTGLPLQFAVAAIATCAFWLFGYDMSV